MDMEQKETARSSVQSGGGWKRLLIWSPVSFGVCLLLVWGLYPFLNGSAIDAAEESRYNPNEGEQIELTGLTDDPALFMTEQEARRFFEQRWVESIDSLERENRALKDQIDALEQALASAREASLLTGSDGESEAEESRELVQGQLRSLLNLDEREMAPILNRLEHEQLVRIFREAGNMQREKILRALSAERSVKLISEVLVP